MLVYLMIVMILIMQEQLMQDERALVAPYYVNYHLEHHLLMFIPCYKLKDAHRMLVEKQYDKRMEIKQGYISLLKSVLV